MYHEERETAAAAKDASTAGTSPTVELKHAQQKASNVKTAANGTISLKCVSPDKGKVYTLWRKMNLTEAQTMKNCSSMH